MLEHLALVGALLTPLMQQEGVDVVEELLTQLAADLLLVGLHAMALRILLQIVLLASQLLLILQHVLRLQYLVRQNLLVGLHNLAQHLTVVRCLFNLLEVVHQVHFRQVHQVREGLIIGLVKAIGVFRVCVLLVVPVHGCRLVELLSLGLVSRSVQCLIYLLSVLSVFF